MTILNFIASSNFITLNKTLIKMYGLEEAVILGELASEFDYWLKKEQLENGWFYSTIENIEENTGLNDYKQRKTLKHLEELELIQIKIKGIPAKRYIKINEEQLLKAFDFKFFKNSRTGIEKIKELDFEILKGNNNIINNNNINKKKKKETEFDVLIKENFKNKEVINTVYEFIKMRKAIKKPLTTRGLELIIKKLYKMTTNIDEQIEILNNSIMNNWQGIFEIKKENKVKNNNSNQREYDNLDFLYANLSEENIKGVRK